MRPQFDDRDAEILLDRLALWAREKGPRVGDFVIMPDGELRRFAHRWSESLQPTWKGEGGSFHFDGAFCNYSGSLDHPIPLGAIEDTGEVRYGDAWFFHHGFPQAHSAVYFKIPCRVYRALRS